MGKWFLHQFYSKDTEIRSFLPPTSLFNEDTLQDFMERYGTVYIKPDKEHMGKGIIKAWKTHEGYAFVILRGEPIQCFSLDELFREIKNRSLPQPYIIQKAIPLAQIDNRIFDIRVLMMRNRQDRWQFFGILSKVAGPQSVITNIVRSKGYVTTFEDSLEQSLGYSAEQAENVKQQLIRLSHRICQRAGKIKYYQKIGNDFAMDKNGNIWLIEVNFTYPGLKVFASLPGKKYYRTVKKMNAILRLRRPLRKKEG